MQAILSRLLDGRDLDAPEMERAFDLLMTGKATPAQIGAFLTALRIKGETAEEIAAAARVMRRHRVAVATPGLACADTCGTGGDGRGSFNFSTAAAFVAAAAGVPVAKHGNRSVSSRSGSTDVLEALGVRVDMTAAEAQACLAATGFCYMHAPLFHPALRHATGPRRELGVRTIFNLLGPLANPAEPAFQVVGVYDPARVVTLAEVLRSLGVRRAVVVHSNRGFDEATPHGVNAIALASPEGVRRGRLSGKSLGLKRCSDRDLAGGSAEENASLLKAILDGSERGPRRDTVALNAALVFMAAGRCRKAAEGLALASRTLDSGAAAELLRKVQAFSAGLSRSQTA